MKSEKLSSLIALAAFALALVPANLAAEEEMANAKKPKHHHYKLIDLGTLGGPSAYKSVNAPGYQILNSTGIVSFGADTPLRDPNGPNLCYEPDCFVAHATRWSKGAIADLGALPGNGNGSQSGAINARRWVTGQSENGEVDPLSGLPEVRGVLWKDEQIIDLGTFGGNWSLGITLNDSGDVVGFAANSMPDPYSFFPPAGTQIHAFLWSKDVLHDLGTLGGDDSQATSINQRGQVVGNSYTNTTANQTTGIPTVHPFLWDHGTMKDLGTLGGTYAGAGECGFGAPCNIANPFEGSLLVNNRGQVIGTSNLAGDQVFHPFLWERGIMQDLGTLGGDNGTAIWLSDTGEVVGEADLPTSPLGCSGLTCTHHAFLWKKGKMTDLGTLGSDPCSRALMSNAKGQIVGTTIAICGYLSTHAFLSESGGPMVDLETLVSSTSGASLFEADNINEGGEIVASGLPAGCSDRFSCGHLYLLIPCDDDHPDVEGCDYSMVEAAEVSSDTSATRAPQSTQLSKEAIARMMSASRNPFMRRYRPTGLRPAPSN